MITFGSLNVDLELDNGWAINPYFFVFVLVMFISFIVYIVSFLLRFLACLITRPAGSE